MKEFDRCSFWNSLKEMIGLNLYFDGEKYFYAWNADNALKNIPGKTLFMINCYGEKIDVIANSTEIVRKEE